MSNTILPDDLKRKIRALAEDSYSTVEIFDAVFTEANQYVDLRSSSAGASVP